MISDITITHCSEPDKLRRGLLSSLGQGLGRPAPSDLAIRAKAQIRDREAAAKSG
jgi:hypothetical protein